MVAEADLSIKLPPTLPIAASSLFVLEGLSLDFVFVDDDNVVAAGVPLMDDDSKCLPIVVDSINFCLNFSSLNASALPCGNIDDMDFFLLVNSSLMPLLDADFNDFIGLVSVL